MQRLTDVIIKETPTIKKPMLFSAFIYDDKKIYIVGEPVEINKTSWRSKKRIVIEHHGIRDSVIVGRLAMMIDAGTAIPVNFIF